MLQTAEYWREIYTLRDQLLKAHGPAVFIVSIKAPRGTLTTPGAVVEATALLAAQRITDSTHELASDEQVRQWKQLQVENGKLIQNMERRNRKAFHRTTTPEVAE